MRLKTLLFTAACCGFSTASVAQDTSFDVPSSDIYRVPADTPTMAPFWAKRFTGYLTTRDGVRLRYSALLPNGKGPFPVIVNYSGYDPGSIGGKSYLQNDQSMSTTLDRDLIEHGYAVVGVNARGTACSEGIFDFLGPDYGRDGRDAIEFIATRPWSNGAIGMGNWSWAGMSQLATASERPPHLKAIAPGMVLGDPRLDSWAPGGVPAPLFVSNWWEYLHSRWEAARDSAIAEGDQACVAQIAVNMTNAEPHSLPTFLLQHPLRDETIEQRHLAARTQNITVPVLSMESFQDEAVTSRGGYYHDTLDASKLWLIQTNGGHDLYDSDYFHNRLIAFYDRFVKGQANGFDQLPHVQVWMQTTSSMAPGRLNIDAKPTFTVERQAYPVEVTPYILNLDTGGTLTQQTGGGDPDAYAYPRPGVAVDTDEADIGADDWSTLEANWRAGVAVYTSAPMDHTLVAYGSASADLWISATTADTDIQVTLTEVRPDGQEMFVQRGWLRMSDRAQDDGQATIVRPVPLDKPANLQALKPGVPALGRVELNKFAHTYRKGSRIRIWIDTPSRWGGYGFTPTSAPSTNRVWHDAAHPSRLVLGELTKVQPPAALPQCGTVLKQPCRPDPLAAR
jgi:putative CocE/NonD family hydrolase